MALKDDVLNKYFKAPLSRRKKHSENSLASELAVPQKLRFFHDREINLDSASSKEESENSIIEAQENLKNVLYDKNSEKYNSETIREKRHNSIAFFTTAPSSLNELSILIKKTKGLQKDVLHYIIDKCRSSGSLDSGPVDLLDISNKYNSTTDFVRTAIKRLLAKNLILKGNGKTGPTGYSVFYIPSEVKEIILNIQSKF